VLLRNASGYLAPGCRIIVTVPGGPRTAFDRHIGHRKHFTESSLRSLLTRSGFVVQTIHRAGFPFFNLYKLAVLLRGQALIADLERSSDHKESLLSRAVLRFFELTLDWSRRSSPFGWQLVAVAGGPIPHIVSVDAAE
jgi:hypothetical protein